MSDVRTLLAGAAQALAAVSPDPFLDAQVLLAHALQRDRAWLFAWPDHQPDSVARDRFAALLERRIAGTPVAHLTGEREFWSLALRVTPDTLIPRPETEHLVEIALALDLPARVRALDLGTGSGAIALVLGRERPAWEITAVDRSPAALQVAQANLRRHGVRNVELACSDWFAALSPACRFELIVVNPPYIAAADPHLRQGDVRFEPGPALVSGADGLQAIRHIAATAPRYLAAGGWLWLEHGYRQATSVRQILAQHGFNEPVTHRDLAGHARHTGARCARTGEARSR